MKINNWAVVFSHSNPYLAPELWTPRLNGAVYGKEGFNDGDVITTTEIVGIDSEDRILTRSGSSYELGDVHPDYDEAFPGSKERLVESLRNK